MNREIEEAKEFFSHVTLSVVDKMRQEFV